MYTFERSVVLQHLEQFLESCPQQERERIDPKMYKCISDMAAVERMLSILELHRPNFAYLAQSPFLQPRQAWQVHFWLVVRPSDLSCTRLDLGSVLESSASFRMPMGRRDEQWLAQRDRAQQNLSYLWRKARHAYQMILEASKVPPTLIETQLAMMKQGDSLENKAQLDLEKQQILGRLEAAKQRALAKSMIPNKDTTATFISQPDQSAHRIQEPAKDKTKSRPDAPSASANPHTKYATAFANLVIDDEIHETEKPPPALYTLEQTSTAFQVISLMFPDRSKGIAEDGEND